MTDAAATISVDPADRVTSEMLHVARRADDLTRIIEATNGLSPSGDPAALLRQVAERTQIPLNDIKTVFSALENIRLLGERLGSSDKALNNIIEQISPEVAKEVVAQRSKITDALDVLDNGNPLALSYKAQRLTYKRERLLQSAEIITDARPIFNKDASVVEEFIITHELVLTWFAGVSDHHIQHFALDNADVVSLSKACEKAIVKAATLKKTLSAVCHTEIARDES